MFPCLALRFLSCSEGVIFFKWYYSSNFPLECQSNGSQYSPLPKVRGFLNSALCKNCMFGWIEYKWVLFCFIFTYPRSCPYHLSRGHVWWRMTNAGPTSAQDLGGVRAATSGWGIRRDISVKFVFMPSHLQLYCFKRIRWNAASSVSLSLSPLN